jgi:hypothetical protein
VRALDAEQGRPVHEHEADGPELAEELAHPGQGLSQARQPLGPGSDLVGAHGGLTHADLIGTRTPGIEEPRHTRALPRQGPTRLV